MWRKEVVAVCVVVGLLGLLSAATGFAAEAKRIKGDQVQFPSPSICIYPRTPALALGLTSAIALLIAHIIINVATGCICCTKPPPRQSASNWTLALVCFLVSWFTFVIAFLLLLTGAALNEQHGQDNLYFGNYYCYVVKGGVFAGAAVLSLATLILGIIYYLTFTTTSLNTNTIIVTPTNQQGGIAMGQPQFPPLNPVFVHHDTYIRRQFV